MICVIIMMPAAPSQRFAGEHQGEKYAQDHDRRHDGSERLLSQRELVVVGQKHDGEERTGPGDRRHGNGKHGDLDGGPRRLGLAALVVAAQDHLYGENEQHGAACDPESRHANVHGIEHELCAPQEHHQHGKGEERCRHRYFPVFGGG